MPLRAYPSHFHRILPPCPDVRIDAVENELGQLPPTLKAMLTVFNGAKLFCNAGPSFSLFGISTIPQLSPANWAEDWYIDKFTQEWRISDIRRRSDWAIAITNYGGVFLLDENEAIKEWDTSQGVWLLKDFSVEAWIEKIIGEGEAIMLES